MSDDGEQVCILMVDDRPGNLLSLGGILERPDYKLVTASSGEEALQLVLREEFAVILLDVAMPGMDGFEVASTIKQHEKFKAIPIIFVTASVHHIEWIFKAYSVGAVDFLQKPLDPHAVRAKVSVFVELYRQKQELKRHGTLIQEFERRERQNEVAQVLLESERRYRNLAEAIPHIVWTADEHGEIDFFNRRWFEATGLKEAESLGSAWLHAIHPDDVERARSVWRERIDSANSFQFEARLRCADGSYRWFRCHALPERDEAGSLSVWIGTLTDVDEQRRVHSQLEAAVKLRDEFLSIASHELRTPLSALQLQIEALHRSLARGGGNTPSAERVQAKLSTAVRHTERLARLIDSLLDVSRIARGRLELQVEDFDLADAVRDVVERFTDEASRARCELQLSIHPVMGCWDRLRIEQIITNLLSNALKYGAAKPISIAVTEAGDSAVLKVIDHGIGIDQQKLQCIFERFERGVSARNYGGMGLGLYIVRQIVIAHDGEIGVESRPGEGAVFTVALPRYRARRELSIAPEAHG